MKIGKGFCPACILLPNQGADFNKWAVVACDQFTSQPDYWEKLRTYVGAAPSALNLIFPEVYLGQGRDGEIIDGIERKCGEYLDSGFFELHESCFIYTKRTLPDGRTRKGLVGRIDLEDYSYDAGAKSDVRATEATILSRIPPRVKIREKTKLELPHIMVLVDDPSDSVMLAAENAAEREVYNFPLNMAGGAVSGRLVKDCRKVTAALDRLGSRQEFLKKYGREDAMTFAVGDGNHSLATAKRHWENLKSRLGEEELASHPARFALVELVNLYDAGLEFEPIHRAVFGVEPEDFLAEFAVFFDGSGGSTRVLYGGKSLSVSIPAGGIEAVKAMDSFLEDFDEVDYIHGEEHLGEVVSGGRAVGIIFPKIKKSELFGYCIANGALPKKTFSMGEAEEKRYYLEARLIAPSGKKGNNSY